MRQRTLGGSSHGYAFEDSLDFVQVGNHISTFVLGYHGASAGAFSTGSLLGGPVHYRWMFPFERFFHWLKQKAKNKAQPQSSMMMAYLIFEIKTFGSHYFDPKLPAMMPTIPRNDVQHDSCTPITFDVFHSKGSTFGRARKRHLTLVEYNAVHLHVLLNCKEVQLYVQ